MERMVALMLVLVLVPWVMACSHPHHQKKGKHGRLKEHADSHEGAHIVRKLAQDHFAKPLSSSNGDLAGRTAGVPRLVAAAEPDPEGHVDHRIGAVAAMLDSDRLTQSRLRSESFTSSAQPDRVASNSHEQGGQVNFGASANVETSEPAVAAEAENLHDAADSRNIKKTSKTKQKKTKTKKKKLKEFMERTRRVQQ